MPKPGCFRAVSGQSLVSDGHGLVMILSPKQGGSRYVASGEALDLALENRDFSHKNALS